MEPLFDMLLAANFKILAIPVFVMLIVCEWAIARRRGLALYRFNDSINSLSCGFLSLLMNAAYGMILVDTYLLVKNSFGIINIEHANLQTKVIAFVLLLIIIDFIYYLGHRFSHRVNIGWAGHVTHHSSEEYNFTTALRQSGLEMGVVFAFALPIAALGIPATWYFSVASLNIAFQFWVHTQTINRCPNVVELIFNTPSHHRVHHARNEQYLDRNFGGMFIVWDRLFGTFTPESEPPCFGITTPLRSWNPLTAQFHYLGYLLSLLKHRHCKEWPKIMFGSPSSVEVMQAPKAHTTAKKFDPAYSSESAYWALGYFLAGGTASLIALSAGTPLLSVLAGSAAVFALSRSGHWLTVKYD